MGKLHANFDHIRQSILLVLLSLVSGCRSETVEESFILFNNAYRVDSVAGENELSEPFYVTITKDSLFSAFGYGDYSYPYDAGLRINDSLQVRSNNQKFSIEPGTSGFWINSPDGKRRLYSRIEGKFDSIYKHLRIIDSRESLLRGRWKFRESKSESNKLLSCILNDSSTLIFTRRDERKFVILENFKDNLPDTCFRTSYKLDGDSRLSINDYDTFDHFKILKLDSEKLIIQEYFFGRILTFTKVQ